MQVLLDTNVLPRIAEPTHILHQIATNSVRSLQAQGHELLIVPQSIYEFWSVATRTVEGNGLGRTPAYAASLIVKFCSLFRLLRDERSIYETWLQLVSDHEIKGVKSFDARLAAAMLRHNISQLLTFNPGDFRQFKHVTILEPATIIPQIEKGQS